MKYNNMPEYVAVGVLCVLTMLLVVGLACIVGGSYMTIYPTTSSYYVCEIKNTNSNTVVESYHIKEYENCEKELISGYDIEKTIKTNNHQMTGITILIAGIAVLTPIIAVFALDKNMNPNGRYNLLPTAYYAE